MKLFSILSNKKNEPLEGFSYLIVGLGNPGREYQHNRHNVGFMAIDHLSKELDIPMKKAQFKAIIGLGKYQDVKLIFAKPQTYMNLSGEAVGSLMRFYKIPIEKILVIHDDLDLPFGTLRIRKSGGAGGQKGLLSIINRLGTQNFSRMRIGIGRPPGQMDPAAYVLQDFLQAEQNELPFIFNSVSEAVKVFILDGIENSMNRFNGVINKD